MQPTSEPGPAETLHRFPKTVYTEFQKGYDEASKRLAPEQVEAWAKAGVEIAEHSFRSWESATEYFRATPLVLPKLTFEQLMGWAQWGRSLAASSPIVSSAFFRATPEVLDRIPPENIGQWAGLGKGLYRSTWKSSSLAATFFETSPKLLQSVSLFEIEELVVFIDVLAQKSYDLAAECLILADSVFVTVDRPDRKAFLGLAAALARANWRDVKPYFEQAPRAIYRVEKSQRPRYLALADRLARMSGGNVVAFLNESADALDEIAAEDHAEMLGLAEQLAGAAPAAVGEFLRGLPSVLSRVRGQQLAQWFEEGLRLLKENEDSGMAFFRQESGRSEQLLETLSHGVTLERVKDVLAMYCRALAGQEVELQATEMLKERKIGWNSAEEATTEGNNIYLPVFIDRYHSKEENFSWFKVISTHQVAHLEFGSFAFVFDRPSAVYAGREQRHTRAPAAPDRLAISDLQRLFDSFGDRRLASEIFTLVEDCRIDHRVTVEYKGIAPAYRRVQAEAVSGRPAPSTLPLREAAMEVLVRLSLEDVRPVSVPAPIALHLDAIKQVMRAVQNPEATIEDTAEATIRLYEVVSRLPNVLEPDPQDQEEQGMQQESDEPDMEQMEKMLQDLLAQMSQGEGQPEGEQQEYKSPEKIEFRGEFKPELVQALEQLREKEQKAEGEMETNGVSPQDLKHMLEQSVELDVTDGQEGDLDQMAAAFADNLMSQVSQEQQQRSGQGDNFPHVADDDAPLSAKEPQAFLYDEWDFRAVDYKPRWCRVRERRMEEGNTEFFENTLRTNSGLVSKIKRQFEMLAPESMRKIKHLPDGDEYDFDLVVESIIDKLTGDTPSDKVYWRRNKVERDVAVAFLLDMSASTAEAVDESRRQPDSWDFPDDPRDYMAWLRNRREEMTRRSYKRIIDIEKESTVLLITALEAIGDHYGIYGFSGYGRENVEFYVIKDLAERFGDVVKKRIDKITPMHATRMGPAIRHAIAKLDKQDARTKLLFLLSDGRPQDRGYSREGVEKEYAVHDTRKALLEARRKHITPFCLTVDRSGHDYLKTMCADMGYEVVTDIHSLPSRLPQLYRRLTV